MEKVLNLKVPPNLLVYSNPCKIVQDLLYARKNNISLTVFDSEDELLKIKKFFPDSKLLIRIRHDDERSALVIGRFGVLRNQVRSLIDKCWELELQIVGVAFHVGHGSSGPGAYVAAIEEAKTFFDYAQEHGKPFHVLDIGGGFPGSFGASTVPLVEVSLKTSIDPSAIRKQQYWPIKSLTMDVLLQAKQIFFFKNRAAIISELLVQYCKRFALQCTCAFVLAVSVHRQNGIGLPLQTY